MVFIFKTVIQSPYSAHRVLYKDNPYHTHIFFFCLQFPSYSFFPASEDSFQYAEAHLHFLQHSQNVFYSRLHETLCPTPSADCFLCPSVHACFSPTLLPPFPHGCIWNKKYQLFFLHVLLLWIYRHLFLPVPSILGDFP